MTHIKAQQGMGTLAVIMILLFALTLVSLSATRLSISEIEISANDERAKENQTQAEALLNFAQAWMGSNSLPWPNAATTTLSCPGQTACPALPAVQSNAGGAYQISVSFERNPASPAFITISSKAEFATNKSRAICRLTVNQSGIAIPGTWRDF